MNQLTFTQLCNLHGRSTIAAIVKELVALKLVNEVSIGMNIGGYTAALALDGVGQTHPLRDLVILNYSKEPEVHKEIKAETLMGDVLRACRGTVCIKDIYVPVSSTLTKFFNNGELPYQISDDEIVRYSEKLDGSFIHAFVYGGEWRFVTRGQFSSEQALAATLYYQNNIDGFRDILDTFKKFGFSFGFELIGPKNRIVVPYTSEQEGLYLLASWNCETGDEISLSEQFQSCFEKFTKRVEVKFEKFGVLREKVMGMPWTEEGIVVQDSNGFRMKLKSPAYCERHRVRFNLSERTVWEAMRDEHLDALIDSVPEEEEKMFIQEVGNRLYEEVDHLKGILSIALDELKDKTPREIGMGNLLQQYSEVVQSLYWAALKKGLDSKEVYLGLMKAVRPYNPKNMNGWDVPEEE